MLRRDFLAGALTAPISERPNVVFVLVDDMRFDELRCTGHPFAQTPHADRLAREGANFRNAFATTPLCSPSRACFLTGTYAHTNGILDNVARDQLSRQLTTWPRLLHDAGYGTAFVGKWHMGNDDSPAPGFDRWVSFRGQGECNDPPLNVDGKNVSSTGYVTDILTDYAVEFLDRGHSKPFCLYMAHKAIHPNIQQTGDSSIDLATINDPAYFIPAERHGHLYSGETPPRRGNYGKPPTGKPALERRIEDLPPLDRTTVTSDEAILNRLRMAKAVDESLGRVLTVLEKRGQLDRTLLVFTSDHGYFYGEHCLGPERRLAYEETIRIPLLVRYPKQFVRDSKPDDSVLSIDVAASVLSLAGIPFPRQFHGRPLWSRPRRDAVLVECFEDTVFPRIRNMGYSAVRTSRWKYIHYWALPASDELYDLKTDPYELVNRIGDRSAPLEAMKRRLNSLLAESADSRHVS